MRLEDLEGKRVAVLGYGREGRSAARLLAGRTRPGALDVFTGEAPAERGEREGFRIRPGLPPADELAEYDVIVRSPGISPYRPPLSDLPVGGESTLITGTEIWFAEHPDARTVVITGSKGKSTTAALTAHLLSARGFEVALGGNIGVPLLDLMDPDPNPDVWVIELSSYQIHGLRARPSIAVVLNLFPEHLDWHGTTERYYEDKLSLLDELEPGIAVLNHADAELRERAPGKATVRWYNEPSCIHWEDDRVLDGERVLFELDSFPLPGGHNRSNLCAALTVLDVLGVDPGSAGDSAASFRALPHRLCSLGVSAGVEYVDDSISTTPRATAAALGCFPDRPVTVLVGGYDRGLDWSAFADSVRRHARLHVITFGALGPRIAADVRQAGIERSAVIECGTLESAVRLAQDVTPKGGVVLLSPGAPSFDAFRDYQARGEVFARLAGFG